MRAAGIRFILAAAACAVALLAPAAGQARASDYYGVRLAWSPTTSFLTYDFGTVAVQNAASQTFKLTNSGGKSSQPISVVLLSSSVFTKTADGCTSQSLAPGQSCNVTVQYAPTTSGSHNYAALGAVSPGALAGLLLKGSGGTYSLAWTPTTSPGTYGFGTVSAGNTLTQTFTLTNTGTGRTSPLTSSLSNTSGSAFSITSDGCTGTSLAPGGSCNVALAYGPVSNGESDAGTLAAGNASLSLTGTGGPEALNLSPGTFESTGADGDMNYGYDFGIVTGGTSASTTFTITNGGTGTSEPLQLFGCCHANFTVLNDTCSGTSLTPAGTAGDSCTLDIEYTPPAGCPGAPYHTPLNIVGTGGTDYVFLVANGECQAGS